MFIETERTPNPLTLKFLPGAEVIKTGTAEFSSSEAAAPHPLPRRLFDVPGVVRVLLGQDFVSVSRAEDTSWDALKPGVFAALLDHYTSGFPALSDKDPVDCGPAASEGPEDEIVMQIKELLETRVRPAVMMDGGDIAFSSFEDGIVYLQMKGACSGCPSSTATLKSGIENMLRHFIPEVREVRPAA